MSSNIIDIIVPAYNSEKYLQRCLASVMVQDIAVPYRVILIDDGSTDRTYEIAKEFEDIYPDKLKYLHKENGGQSSARNLGISNVSAEYIVFVDSDDYVEPDYLSTLYDSCCINESDISMCAMNRCPDDIGKGSRFDSGFNKDFVTTNILDVLSRSSFAPWNKMYKSSLFVGLSFPEGMTYEDFALIPQVMYRARRISYIDKVLYHYYINDNSTIMKLVNKKKVNRDIIKAQHILEESELSGEKELLCNFYIRRVICSLVWGLFEFKEDRSYAIQLVDEGLYKYSEILRNDALEYLSKLKRLFCKLILKRHFFWGGVLVSMYKIAKLLRNAVRRVKVNGQQQAN